MLSLLLFYSCIVRTVKSEGPKYPRETTNSTTTTIASTGSTQQNCSWSWSSWNRAQHSAELYTSTLVTSTYTYHNITASTSVGCDGIVRIVGDLSTLATGTNVSTSYTYYATNVSTVATPTCTPTREDCKSLMRLIPDGPPCSLSGEEDCGRCSIYGGGTGSATSERASKLC